MTACEKCWRDASFRAATLGGSVSDHYRALLDERRDHPCNEEGEQMAKKKIEQAPQGTDTIVTDSSLESDGLPSDPETLHEALANVGARMGTAGSPEGEGSQDEPEFAPRHEEWHVTVEGDPVDWLRFLSGSDDRLSDPYYNGITVKPLYIELANFQTQLMCSMNVDPSVPTEEGSIDFLSLCDRAGFTVIRIKHEVSDVRPGETPIYYEAHVKLDGPFRTDRPGASRDLYRRERWYRTQRSKQPFDAATWVSRATSQSRPSQLAGFEYEACLLDTNPALDAGWL